MDKKVTEISSINHHKDLKHLSEMIDNFLYLFKKGWTKDELKGFIDKYCLEELVETIKIKEIQKDKDNILNSFNT